MKSQHGKISYEAFEQSVLEHREIVAALKATNPERAGNPFAIRVERTGAIVSQTAAVQVPSAKRIQMVIGKSKNPNKQAA